MNEYLEVAQIWLNISSSLPTVSYNENNQNVRQPAIFSFISYHLSLVIEIFWENSKAQTQQMSVISP